MLRIESLHSARLFMAPQRAGERIYFISDLSGWWSNCAPKARTWNYVVFENEGHDVLKYENKVRCYNAITEFFKKHLRP